MRLAIVICCVTALIAYRAIVHRALYLPSIVAGHLILRKEASDFYDLRAKEYEDNDVDGIVDALDLHWSLSYGSDRTNYGTEIGNLNALFASADHLVYKASVKRLRSRGDVLNLVIQWSIRGKLKKGGQDIAANGESLEVYDFALDRAPIVLVQRVSLKSNNPYLLCVF